MRKTVLATLFAISFGISSPAYAATILVEDFEAAFPAWESGWLGVNSNLENYYVSAGGPNTDRGNNPDGLWLSDADGTFSDPLVNIVFEAAFASTLTAFSIDVAGYLPAMDLRVYDAFGNTLLLAPVAPTGGAYTDPGTYVHFSVVSGTGIGGFSFLNGSGQIEGNTSIDNVSVTVNGAQQVPEPASLLLLGTGLLGAGVRRRRQRRA